MHQLMRIQDAGVFIKGVSGLASLDAEGGVSDQRCPTQPAYTMLWLDVARQLTRSCIACWTLHIAGATALSLSLSLV